MINSYCFAPWKSKVVIFFVNEYNIEAKRPILYSSRPIIADIMYISNKE